MCSERIPRNLLQGSSIFNLDIQILGDYYIVGYILGAYLKLGGCHE